MQQRGDIFRLVEATAILVKKQCPIAKLEDTGSQPVTGELELRRSFVFPVFSIIGKGASAHHTLRPLVVRQQILVVKRPAAVGHPIALLKVGSIQRHQPDANFGMGEVDPPVAGITAKSPVTVFGANLDKVPNSFDIPQRAGRVIRFFNPAALQ